MHRQRSEGGDAGYALTQDEGMHVVRTLIGLYGFQIHHVPHDWIIVRDAVGAENVPGYARAFQRHPDIISFRHGDVVMTNLPASFMRPTCRESNCPLVISLIIHASFSCTS